MQYPSLSFPEQVFLPTLGTKVRISLGTCSFRNKLHNLPSIIPPFTLPTYEQTPGMVGTLTAGKCMDKIARRNMTNKKAIRYFIPPPLSLQRKNEYVRI
ncbi:hypothetical protein TNCT_535091 [Trichonephila clavata]|uniref:Uncharacterized protein n=1 Tax=Trichonephila clavata TaxID=2740835 RepID=A0A8X6JL82_TRICU|nr:hypothetical protein TNCT_535091 [Trichonephila clavata]